MLEDFQISPEYCLIVRAFGRTQSLREAAKLLNCDPTSLVRKARTIADDYGLIEKINGRWVLTEKGNRTALWVEQSILAQKLAISEKPRQRITTTMWLAEQLLIPNFSELNTQTQGRFNWSFRTASSNFESDLLKGITDYVFACHPPSDPLIAYRNLAPEQWVVITPSNWGISSTSPSKQLEYLKNKPFIRHLAITPETAIGFQPPVILDDLVVDSLISVRTAVQSGHGWSCVPRVLAQTMIDNQSLSIAKLTVQSQSRFSLWWLRSRPEQEPKNSAIIRWLKNILESAN